MDQMVIPCYVHLFVSHLRAGYKGLKAQWLFTRSCIEIIKK
jgi:hypothetical protein